MFFSVGWTTGQDRVRVEFFFSSSESTLTGKVIFLKVWKVKIDDQWKVSPFGEHTEIDTERNNSVQIYPSFSTAHSVIVFTAESE